MSFKQISVQVDTYERLLERKLKRSVERKEDLSFNDLIAELLEKTKIDKGMGNSD